MSLKARTLKLRLGALAILALTLSQTLADDANQLPTLKWPGDFLARVEIVALLETLDAELLSHDSATLTLEHWCATHRLATPATVTAARVTDAAKAPSPEQRQDLRVSATEPIGYRRVKLSCGSVLLSEADNWYVPSRLTPEMNRILETTDSPFGKVVLPLKFQRHTLNSTMLWSALPEHWEMSPIPIQPLADSLQIPESLLQHTAVLTLPDGTPISEVIETYKNGLLRFPAPH
jgi:chorismate-pyruvate lyase